jgi:ribosomal protein S27AE
VSTFETSRAKSVDKINKDYNSVLRRIAHTPIEFETRRINDFHSGIGPGSMDGITHFIETNDGGKIASLTILLHYTAYGLARPIVWEGMTCYCGSFVNKTIPVSIIVKNVKEGLRKKPYFLPYVEMPIFSAKDVLRKKAEWNRLIDDLNGDESLRSLLKKLPTEKTIHGIDERYQAGRDKIWSYKLDDLDDNYNTLCQIISLGNRTLIATRHMVEDPRRIEQAVKAIIRIREHVLNFGYNKLRIGKIPQQWANDVIELVKRYASPPETLVTDLYPKSETKLEPFVHKAEQVGVESQQICPRCGAETSPEMRYCGECGFNLSSIAGVSTCPRCGAGVHSRMNFCGRCGVPLAP